MKLLISWSGYLYPDCGKFTDFYLEQTCKCNISLKYNDFKRWLAWEVGAILPPWVAIGVTIVGAAWLVKFRRDCPADGTLNTLSPKKDEVDLSQCSWKVPVLSVLLIKISNVWQKSKSCQSECPIQKFKMFHTEQELVWQKIIRSGMMYLSVRPNVWQV